MTSRANQHCKDNIPGCLKPVSRFKISENVKGNETKMLSFVEILKSFTFSSVYSRTLGNSTFLLNVCVAAVK